MTPPRVASARCVGSGDAWRRPAPRCRAPRWSGWRPRWRTAGPTTAASRSSGSVGLVHRRLAIVDPTPAGHAPMRGADGRWWLTYNGEVVQPPGRCGASLGGRAVARRVGHRDACCEALAALGRRTRVPRLNGLFAFAALDPAAAAAAARARPLRGQAAVRRAPRRRAVVRQRDRARCSPPGVPRERRPRRAAARAGAGWVNGAVDAVARRRRAVLPGTLLAVSLDTLEVRERRWYDPPTLSSRTGRRRSTPPRRALARARARAARLGAPAADGRRPGRDDVLGRPRLAA